MSTEQGHQAWRPMASCSTGHEQQTHFQAAPSFPPVCKFPQDGPMALLTWVQSPARAEPGMQQQLWMKCLFSEWL